MKFEELLRPYIFVVVFLKVEVFSKNQSFLLLFFERSLTFFSNCLLAMFVYIDVRFDFRGLS